MIKMLLTVALLGSAGFSSFAMAQDNGADAHGDGVASSLAKLEAQCAHRRIMPPDPRDDCARRLWSNAQLGYGQDDASASSNIQAVGAGIGPGNAGGKGNSLGPGNGGGQGKGRR